jgi:hypothetical protein
MLIGDPCQLGPTELMNAMWTDYVMHLKASARCAELLGTPRKTPPKSSPVTPR